MATEHEPQRIARLTPLANVLARIDALVTPVASRQMDLAAAVGHTLAADVIVSPRPSTSIALRDGFAVRAESIVDATSYAPALLAPPPSRIDVGSTMPAGMDAVALLDAVVSRDGRFEATAPVVAGEGMLAQHGDTRAGQPLRGAGERLRNVDTAVLAAAGLTRVTVRAPRICLVKARAGDDAVLDAARDLIAAGVTAAGGEVKTAADSATALTDNDADAVIVIGGTGSGRNDESVHALARAGRVEVHGVALRPGETAAFGRVGTKPVLLVPGRLDAALAVWLTLGHYLLARLSGNDEELSGTHAVLSRKIASPLGFTEIVPVRCHDGKAEPIASGYWPLSAIAQSNGWILVPADSEGYRAGAEVMLRRWP